MSESSFEHNRSKLAVEGADRPEGPGQLSAGKLQAPALQELQEPADALDSLARQQATQAEKEALMQAIMPYVALLNDMIQKQAERIQRLEDQVKSLQQE
jgi:hypothetical protein